MTNADKFKQIFGLYATELWSKTEGEFLTWLNSDFSQPDVPDTNVGDMISRQAAIDAIGERPMVWMDSDYEIAQRNQYDMDKSAIEAVPSAQPKQTRVFVELVVRYSDPELCTYKEFKGKPYYSIKYIENGETYVGYGTYKPEVLSQYLREYFMPSAQSERETGEWIDYTDEGYVECPFCHSATNCDGNKDELRYCFYCGAELR